MHDVGQASGVLPVGAGRRVAPVHPPQQRAEAAGLGRIGGAGLTLGRACAHAVQHLQQRTGVAVRQRGRGHAAAQDLAHGGEALVQMLVRLLVLMLVLTLVRMLVGMLVGIPAGRVGMRRQRGQLPRHCQLPLTQFQVQPATALARQHRAHRRGQQRCRQRPPKVQQAAGARRSVPPGVALPGAGASAGQCQPLVQRQAAAIGQQEVKAPCRIVKDGQVQGTALGLGHRRSFARRR